MSAYGGQHTQQPDYYDLNRDCEQAGATPSKNRWEKF